MRSQAVRPPRPERRSVTGRVANASAGIDASAQRLRREAVVVNDALGGVLARSVRARAAARGGPLLQRQGFLSWFNPRYYLPGLVGGYSAEQMLAYTSPARLLPDELHFAYRAALNVVARIADKVDPNDVTRAEYDATATLLLDIMGGRTKLVLATSLADEWADDVEQVKGQLKTETMKDLITIAQTETGRDLLTAIARAADPAPRVFIAANDLVVSPAANPRDPRLPASARQITDVAYTPTSYKAGRAVNSPENVEKLEEAKRLNAWILPRRSDVTLYHELVHAYHTQMGTAKAKEALVSAERVVDDVDRPYHKEGIGGEETMGGVSEEEYATVGLGDYASDRFTENRYRRERRQLGEDVPKRRHYTERRG